MKRALSAAAILLPFSIVLSRLHRLKPHLKLNYLSSCAPGISIFFYRELSPKLLKCFKKYSHKADNLFIHPSNAITANFTLIMSHNLNLLQWHTGRIRLVALYIFLIVKKSHKKTKTNNKFILLTSIACAAEAWYARAYSSVPQTSIVVQKLLKTHHWATLLHLHYHEHTHCSLFWLNPTCCPAAPNTH